MSKQYGNPHLRVPKELHATVRKVLKMYEIASDRDCIVIQKGGDVIYQQRDASTAK